MQPASDYEGPDGTARFRRDLTGWMDEEGGALETESDGAGLAEVVGRTRRNQQKLWETGWLRYGWPASVGGFGGPAILRAAVAEEIALRGLGYDSVFATGEVLGPTVIQVAPELAAEYLQPFLSGAEGWGQGFSEPDAGSDLASLRCRAVDAGDHWVVTGQKIWTSYGQFASKIVLLTRTGTPESRHRGITAMLVDMDAPGVTARPLRGMNDQDEFSETFFDGVHVPKRRVIGEVDGGWAVAMSILRSERGAIFWMMAARLLRSFHRQIREAKLDSMSDESLGHAFASIAALRARSWTTQHRMNADAIQTPETSIDKILMATAEQELFDMVQSTMAGALEFHDSNRVNDLRSQYMYSRAASIYGGAAEIQRNIVADQLLGLRSLR
ncbi:MAG: acyl-CoA dehydrogenase family protein [Acidimicrobiaceae bacterium]|nr:acyl-CoA dehydrogenase family protein [Acidimicrobiaceae bacterium]